MSVAKMKQTIKARSGQVIRVVLNDDDEVVTRTKLSPEQAVAEATDLLKAARDAAKQLRQELRETY